VRFGTRETRDMIRQEGGCVLNRPTIVAGNWKMNKTGAETRRLLIELSNKLVGMTPRAKVIVFPPFVALETAVDATRDTLISVGAQNAYWEDSGAFTGEVSVPMLEAVGVTHVLIGHSERRSLFGETDEVVQRKLARVLASTLTPLVCVGETLEQRDCGETESVVTAQLREGLAGVGVERAGGIILAYEPVWAIGTGRTASPETANDVHRLIRRVLDGMFGSVAAEIPLLYGGSVKPDNAAALMSESDVDGALVGGASLDAASFAKIVGSAP